MLCPVCTKDLSSTNVAGISLDTCQECGGIWFQEGRLHKILRKPLESLRQSIQDWRERSVKGEGRWCPQCLHPMVMVSREGPEGTREVVTDCCASCGGIWLDRGELEAIVRALAPRRIDPEAYEEAITSLGVEKTGPVPSVLSDALVSFLEMGAGQAGAWAALELLKRVLIWLILR